MRQKFIEPLQAGIVFCNQQVAMWMIVSDINTEDGFDTRFPAKFYKFPVVIGGIDVSQHKRRDTLFNRSLHQPSRWKGTIAKRVERLHIQVHGDLYLVALSDTEILNYLAILISINLFIDFQLLKMLKNLLFCFFPIR